MRPAIVRDVVDGERWLQTDPEVVAVLGRHRRRVAVHFNVRQGGPIHPYVFLGPHFPLKVNNDLDDLLKSRYSLFSLTEKVLHKHWQG